MDVYRSTEYVCVCMCFSSVSEHFNSECTSVSVVCVRVSQYLSPTRPLIMRSRNNHLRTRLSIVTSSSNSTFGEKFDTEMGYWHVYVFMSSLRGCLESIHIWYRSPLPPILARLLYYFIQYLLDLLFRLESSAAVAYPLSGLSVVWSEMLFCIPLL